MPHHNAIATHRKTWALSQRELGLLLTLSRSSISRLETLVGKPTFSTALALEALFGKTISSTFKGEYTATIEALVPVIAAFSIPLQDEAGSAADRKRELLTEFAKRLELADAAL